MYGSYVGTTEETVEGIACTHPTNRNCAKNSQTSSKTEKEGQKEEQTKITENSC